MDTTSICLCILIISGAIACLSLAVVLIKLLDTLKKVNTVVTSLDVTVNDVNKIVENVETKLKKLDKPLDATLGVKNDGIIKTGLSTALGVTSYAYKKFIKRGENK